MPNVLVLTTDLPFFPGKNGHDFFNLRFLSQRHSVGVVAPLHSHYPAAGVANLEQFVRDAYLWPRPAAPAVSLPCSRKPPERLAAWWRLVPWGLRMKLLRKLLGIHHQPSDAYGQLATLANCAPHLLQALRERRWQVMVLIQSSAEPWLDYLPSHLAKLVYFHDVRADYFRRQALQFPESGVDPGKTRAVTAQERRVGHRADVVAFVSDLDHVRALRLLQPACETGVAPIPVDTDYYTPPPSGWRKNARPIVLFTGHLGHPPNVDAVRHFLREIWPGIRNQHPDAVFQVVGLSPAAVLQAECVATENVELHPNVPDIRPYFWNAAVYVVPMRFGGGVRQKIFEAWSMEAPVVCTTMAAEGIPAAYGRNCWLEDDPVRFASRVSDLIRARDAGLVREAKRTVEAHNAIPKAARRFEELTRHAARVKRQRPYKMLFDLRWMKIGRAGGAEQMSYELIAEIARLDHRNEYRILCPRSAFHEWNFPRGFRCAPRFTDSGETKAEAMRAGLVNLLARSAGKQPVHTPEMRALQWYHRLDCDVVQSMNGYTHTDLRGFPVILTMHDLQHVHHPDFFAPDAWAERETLYRESCAQADHILCISEFTRTDVHRSYGVPLDKMTTIWNIPSSAAWIRIEESACRQLLAGMGIEGRYLFFPAHGWPHKNHARLLEAFHRVRSELPVDLRLVLTGKAFEADHPARSWMESKELRDRVVHLGYRSPLEIRALYRGAHALVFPSLFEGFGMPVAEAIIAGCPVACSNATSLPEIAGDAATYFDPRNSDSIARSLMEISHNDRLRAELLAAGQRRKPMFSARRAAVKTLSVYRKVFEQVYSQERDR